MKFPNFHNRNKVGIDFIFLKIMDAVCFSPYLWDMCKRNMVLAKLFLTFYAKINFKSPKLREKNFLKEIRKQGDSASNLLYQICLSIAVYSSSSKSCSVSILLMQITFEIG